MTPTNTPIRVAILGARGIGRIHARLFNELGANVCAILGSTESSAAVTAAQISQDTGVQVKPFHELHRLLEEPLDAVSICTPPVLHFAQALAALERGVAVFCEKPLFWDDALSLNESLQQLVTIEQRANSRLTVNTSNAAFVDAVRDRIAAPGQVEEFRFRFHTNGPNRGPGIGADLMPHGLSLLLRVLGEQRASTFNATWAEHWYRCEFNYGGRAVLFEFQQASDIARELVFAVNDREFRRVQVGTASTYRVMLHDVSTAEDVVVEDPFRTYISAFLSRCAGQSPVAGQNMTEAALNLRLMLQFMKQPSDATTRA